MKSDSKHEHGGNPTDGQTKSLWVSFAQSGRISRSTLKFLAICTYVFTYNVNFVFMTEMKSITRHYLASVVNEFLDAYHPFKLFKFDFLN